MAGKTKGTKVFTTGRDFEIVEEYDVFRTALIDAHDKGGSTVEATLLDDRITFPLASIVAFIPMIDLGDS